MRHLKLRCLCATCTRVRRAYGTAKLVTPEDCITHILKYGLPAALDTGDESALALLRGHATAEQLPALLPGAAGGVANAQGGHAAAAAPDARAQTTARSDHGAALGAAAGELSGSESPTPQPSVRDGLLAGLADCGGAGERTSGLSSPASDGDAAGAGADGLGRSTSPDSPAGSPERSGGAQPDGGLDGDEAVEELEALMASKLIYPEVEDDLGDDLGGRVPRATSLHARNAGMLHAPARDIACTARLRPADASRRLKAERTRPLAVAARGVATQRAPATPRPRKRTQNRLERTPGSCFGRAAHRKARTCVARRGKQEYLYRGAGGAHLSTWQKSAAVQSLLLLRRRAAGDRPHS